MHIKELMRSKRQVLLYVVVALLASGTTAAIMMSVGSKEHSESASPPPINNALPLDAEFIEASVYHTKDHGSYECSKDIKLKAVSPPKRGETTYYAPVDEAEAKLLCHSEAGGAEYKGKIKVLQKPEIVSLISQHKYDDLSIKALEFKYIQDKDFVNRLLPDFKDKEVGCIIILYTPGGDRVFIQDEALETYQEYNYNTFAAYLDKVSPADRKLFFDNLK